MEKIIASVFWEECKDDLFPHIDRIFQTFVQEMKNDKGCFFLFFDEKFNNSTEYGVIDVAFSLNKLTSFPLEYLSLPKVDLQSLETYLKERDKTSLILDLEDKCLYRGEKSETLDVVFRYLESLKSGKDFPIWAYLDDEKKAVVCFVQDKNWQVRLFCKSDEDREAIHWIENFGFLPVVFRKDISEYLEEARCAGGFCLKQYLPRDIGDLLSKKKNGVAKYSTKQTRGRHDCGDFL